MLIHEIVLQGVPGSPGLSRLTVGKGLSVLVPGAHQPLPLVRLITQILFDESVEPPADLNLSGAEVCRSGLTLQDAAGRVYRIVRDLQRGNVQLLTLDPATRAFSQVSSRPAEVGQFLRAQAQVPAEDLIRELFSLQASDAPSRQPLEEIESAAPTSAFGSQGGLGTGELAGRTMTPPGGLRAAHFPGHANEPPPHDRGMDQSTGTAGLGREEAQRRLEELEAQAAAATEIDEAQFELDGLQQKVDAIDTALVSVRELETSLQGLDQKLERFVDLEALPESFSEKVQTYGNAVDRRDRALERVDSEHDSFSELAAIPALPLLRQPLFLGGLIGVAALGLLVLGLDLRLVAGLLPLALGALALASLLFFDEREDRAGLQRRLGALDERRSKAERSFELETSLVRRTMEQLGADSPAELLTRLDALRTARAERVQVEAKLGALRDTPEHTTREAERARLQQRIDELEAKLASSGGYAQDPADLRREMEGLRAIVGAKSDAPPLSDPAFGGLGGGSFSATPAGLPALSEAVAPGPSGAPSLAPSPPNPGPRALDLLTDITHRPREELVATLSPRLSQYLAALSQGRWRGASFVGRGDLQVDEAAGPSLSWETLPLPDRDLLHLGLRLAMAELAVRHAPVPLFFDEPLLGSAPQPLVQKMLLALATVTQVIVQSSDPTWQSGATAVHRLGA